MPFWARRTPVPCRITTHSHSMSWAAVAMTKGNVARSLSSGPCVAMMTTLSTAGSGIGVSFSRGSVTCRPQPPELREPDGERTVDDVRELGERQEQDQLHRQGDVDEEDDADPARQGRVVGELEHETRDADRPEEGEEQPVREQAVRAVLVGLAKALDGGDGGAVHEEGAAIAAIQR